MSELILDQILINFDILGQFLEIFWPIFGPPGPPRGPKMGPGTPGIDLKSPKKIQKFQFLCFGLESDFVAV